MKNIGLLLLLFALILDGCSTYKARKEGFGNMGYEESKLEDGSYLLSYYGSTMDTETDVNEKWHKRAAELCGKGKYHSDVLSKEWTYDGYIVVLPLVFKTRGASPLVEGKLTCRDARHT